MNCVIEPNMVVELSSRIDGIVDTILVERGDRISAGAIVAKLEAGAEQAAVNHAQARARMQAEIRSYEASLAYSERMRERVANLSEKHVVSSEEIDRVETEARVANFRLQQAKENKLLAELELARAEEVLRRHTIISPIDGVVAERYLNPGESVEEKPIVKLAQIDPLRVEVIVPATEFGQIQMGQHAMVQPESASGEEYASTVTIVDPIIDAASGTFRVSLELPNPEHNLTSGLRCDITFLDNPASVTETLPAN